MVFLRKVMFHASAVFAITASVCGASADQAVVAQDAMLPEKPIVVIIPSYNNSQWYQKNIDSIVTQKYGNFHVIYLDDCSPDGTGQLVENYIKERHLENKVTLIRNTVRRGALANIYSAVHMCDDMTIIITIDGDDWVKHENVLARVNKEYTHNGAWMTYGHYECFPGGTSEPQKEMKPVIVNYNMFREWDWITSHLRTFYAWLFKKIKLEDFLFEGNFFDVTWDMAFMFPMLEMSGEQAKPIPDILYVYNCANPINDFKIKLIRQIHCDKLIRSMSKYSRLKNVPAEVGAPIKNSALGIIFSEGCPEKLEACLSSLKTKLHGKNLEGLVAVYRAHDSGQEKQYRELRAQFSSVSFLHTTAQTLKPLLCELLKKVQTDYVFFAHDGLVLVDSVDLEACVRVLQKTHAHCIFCSVGKNVTKNSCLTRAQALPVTTWIEGDVYSWQFSAGEQDWRTPYSCNMVLYRAANIVPVLEAIQFADLSSLECACNKMRFDMNSVGLFFEKAKAIFAAQ